MKLNLRIYWYCKINPMHLSCFNKDERSLPLSLSLSLQIFWSVQPRRVSSTSARQTTARVRWTSPTSREKSSPTRWTTSTTTPSCTNSSAPTSWHAGYKGQVKYTSLPSRLWTVLPPPGETVEPATNHTHSSLMFSENVPFDGQLKQRHAVLHYWQKRLFFFFNLHMSLAY